MAERESDSGVIPVLPQGQVLAAGDAFGEHRIVRFLGCGGTGEVYEVEHGSPVRHDALKLLPAGLLQDPSAWASFRQDAEALASLQPPGMVRVDGFGETDGRPWLRMELVGGGNGAQSLVEHARAHAGGIPPAETVGIVRAVLAGLARVHDHGLVHGNVKPPNILVGAGGDDIRSQRFLVAEPGPKEWLCSQAQRGALAGLGGTPTMDQRERALLATYESLSPERKLGAAATPASDVYAVGLLAYWLLTGRTVGFRPPSQCGEGVPKWWDELLLTALEEKPEDRFADARRMLAALLVAQEGKLDGEAPANPVRIVRESAPKAPPVPAVVARQAGQSPLRVQVRGLPRQEAPPAPVATEEQSPAPRPRIKVNTEDSERRLAVERQREEAERQAQEEEVSATRATAGRPWTVPGLGMEFVYVPPGSFRPGVEVGEKEEEEGRQVRITQGFWLARYPASQMEFRNLLGYNPSRNYGRDNPVDSISWKVAIRFCARLTAQERTAERLPDGYEYRLPTEAEWEYAARGGPVLEECVYVGSSNADTVAWHVGNSLGRSHPVGRKLANRLGLHDMSGNVWEWCADWYRDADHRASLPEDDPVDLVPSAGRVIRGGSWLVSSFMAKLTKRNGSWPHNADGDTGFRVCLGPCLPRELLTDGPPA